MSANVKTRKPRKTCQEPDKSLRGLDLPDHLREVVDLFLVVSDAAAGEIAGRELKARLLREAIEN